MSGALIPMNIVEFDKGSPCKDDGSCRDAILYYTLPLRERERERQRECVCGMWITEKEECITLQYGLGQF